MSFLKKSLYILIFFLGISANAEYSAFCVKFSGERFVNKNLISMDDQYFRISDDEEIFIVKSKSQAGLQSLCPNGSRLVKEFTKVWIREQITPYQFVPQGHYLKNPKMYQMQEGYEVRTDTSIVK